jgi:hypothetical protein
MGEGKRRREAGAPDERALEMSVDHIWSGVELPETHPDAAKHPDRGERCLNALSQVFREIEEGRGKCTECERPIAVADQMRECSIAHFWNWPPKTLTVAIPFCRACASSKEEVSRLAQKAIAKFTDNMPMHRRQ